MNKKIDINKIKQITKDYNQREKDKLYQTLINIIEYNAELGEDHVLIWETKNGERFFPNSEAGIETILDFSKNNPEFEISFKKLVEKDVFLKFPPEYNLLEYCQIFLDTSCDISWKD